MGLIVSRNARRPESNIFGWLIGKILTSANRNMETKVAELCEIQPNHKVLEVGFGPGFGLKAAYPYVKGGTGMLHGIDFSERMVKMATANLREEISAGKVLIHLGSVMNMPYEDNSFDRVFHCNCYYFWPDLDLGAKEINRVMKPNGVMVTGFQWAMLKKSHERGFLQCANVIDPYEYIDALKKNGFTDVYMKSIRHKRTFEAIYATAKK